MHEREIFAAALDLADPQGRQAYLDEACAGNAELRQRLDELLALEADPESFLSTPAVQQIAGKTTNIDGKEISPANAADYEKTHGCSHEDAEFSLDFLSPSDQPGTLGRLAHYRVHEVLGRGAFGIVLKAFDEKLHRMVAIKVLSPELAKTSPPRKRFLREARASAAIRHENVVAVYAVEEQPIPYLVMEYIPGSTLEQALNRHGPLDVPDVLRLGQQIACGLAAAHGQGIIHRDIKPSNILLENGLTGKVKISDFGLARAADDASLTTSGVIAGTPMYMSPEQALGGQIDQRSDLFSLGSVLYVMSSGHPPFRAATTLAVLKRVVEDTPRPIPEVIAGTPDWLTAIIAKLQAKQRDDRFATAQEIAEMLGRCLADISANRPVVLPESVASEVEKPQTTPVPVIRPVASEQPNRRTSSRRRWPSIVALALIAFVGWGVAERTGITNWTSSLGRPSNSGFQMTVGDPSSVASSPAEGQPDSRTNGGVIEPRERPAGKPLAFTQPGFDDWAKSVAALPAEEQVAAVAKKLRELNPGFDGKVVPKIQEGVVTEFWISADVSDISPVRALPGLTTLTCDGRRLDKVKFADLSPLRGLPLTSIAFLSTPVSDLSPLRGMPLTGLWIASTQVEDLSPLKDAPLTDLNIQSTPVADLSPLQGMMLINLFCTSTKIADLSPLKGMPLRHLQIEGTQVTDLSPLQGSLLESLDISRLSVTNLTPLHGMPLKSLNLISTQVADLSALKGLPLQILHLRRTRVTDFSPLKDLPLIEIRLDFQPERDTELLRSIKTLETINQKPAAEFWQEIEGKK